MGCPAAGSEAIGAVGSVSAEAAKGCPPARTAETVDCSTVGAETIGSGSSRFARAACNDCLAAVVARVASRAARLALVSVFFEAAPPASACSATAMSAWWRNEAAVLIAFEMVVQLVTRTVFSASGKASHHTGVWGRRAGPCTARGCYSGCPCVCRRLMCCCRSIACASSSCWGSGRRDRSSCFHTRINILPSTQFER